MGMRGNATNWSDSIGWGISNYATSTPAATRTTPPTTAALARGETTGWATPPPPSPSRKLATTNENSKNIRIRCEFWLLRLPLAVYLAFSGYLRPANFSHSSLLFFSSYFLAIFVCFFLVIFGLLPKGKYVLRNCTFL